MPYLFTSESVSEGHPDKVADQISDAVIDAMLAQDSDSRVACETLVTTGLAVVSGEVKTKAYVDIQEIVRQTIKEIGYTHAALQFEADSCGVLNAIHAQSPDIARGVDEGADKDLGAGDQGMMFGFATNETPSYMPAPLAYSHGLMKTLADIRKEEKIMTYLRPDSKAQVTIEYNDDDTPKRVHTVVLSTQHDDFVKPNSDSPADIDKAEKEMLANIKADVLKYVVPKVIPAELLDDKTVYHINPTGKFVIGGPHGDTGLTGRKIIVDTYGGQGAHGGGAFSGKDNSKVDRSAAYATRHIAKNMVAAGLCDKALVQVAYAIGVTEPISLNVNTYGTAKVDMRDGEIAEKINEIFDLRPSAIVKNLGLKNPIFRPTAAYGHMGREPYTKEIEVYNYEITESGNERKEIMTKVKKNIEFFTWEKLDRVDDIKKAFGL